MIKHNTQAAENKVTDDFSKHFRSETSRFLTPETKLHFKRPPDEVTTILSRKLVEEKIKKKSKPRSFNFRSRCKRTSREKQF